VGGKGEEELEEESTRVFVLGWVFLSPSSLDLRSGILLS